MDEFISVSAAHNDPAKLREASTNCLKSLDEKIASKGIAWAARDAAKQFKGWLRIDIQKERQLKVVIGGNFTREFLRNLFPETVKGLPKGGHRERLTDKQKIEILKKMVTAMGEFPRILRTGIPSGGWENPSEGKHKGYEFFTTSGFFFYDKKRTAAAFDLMRASGQKEPVLLHNVNVEGTATYKPKSRFARIRHTDSVELEQIELVGIRLI